MVKNNPKSDFMVMSLLHKFREYLLKGYENKSANQMTPAIPRYWPNPPLGWVVYGVLLPLWTPRKGTRQSLTYLGASVAAANQRKFGTRPAKH